MKRPCIAVTMGDPAGVGPEVCLHLLANQELGALCTPVVFGDAAVLHQCAKQAGLPAPSRVVRKDSWAAACRKLDEPAVLDPLNWKFAVPTPSLSIVALPAELLS